MAKKIRQQILALTYFNVAFDLLKQNNGTLSLYKIIYDVLYL